MKQFVAFGVDEYFNRLVIFVQFIMDKKTVFYGETFATTWAEPILYFIESVQLAPSVDLP